VGLGLVALLLLAFAVLTVQYRSAAWWWGPGRVHLMGRDYDRQSGDLTHAQVVAESAGVLHAVGHLPLGQSFEGVRTSDVPTVVYLHEWDGHYVAYALSGGP
jgi:hypothetical protein